MDRNDILNVVKDDIHIFKTFLTRPRPLENGFLKVLGFIVVVCIVVVDIV
jgi:hypothetical protein